MYLLLALGILLMQYTSAEPVAVINEIDLLTGDIELYNPTAVDLPLGYGLYVFNQDKDVVYSSPILNFKPNTCILFKFNMPNLISQLAIIIHPLFSPETYNDLSPSLIVDSFIMTFDGSPNAFSDKLPQWDNKVKQSSDGRGFSRCFTNDGNIPEGFHVVPKSMGVANNCNNVGVTGDPHFYQTIHDKVTKEPINICYDVVGNTQQSIFLLEDKFTETIVKGILLDDYYFHQINIIQKEKMMKINTKLLNYNGNSYNWSTKRKILRFDNIQITLNLNKVDVQVYVGFFNLTATIIRSINKFHYQHLDVTFGKMDKMNSRYGGLIGDIGKKNFQITKGIQFERDTIVKVNDQVVMTKSKKRQMKNCIFINIDELLRPKKLNYYLN